MTRHELNVLHTLIEAVDMTKQPYTPSGAVTPENPGGQVTATRYNGTRVDRVKFLDTAVEAARKIVPVHECSACGDRHLCLFKDEK